MFSEHGEVNLQAYRHHGGDGADQRANHNG
jgi:hypothetical protein